MKVAVAMSGPLLWLVALIAVAVVVDRFDVVGIALAILAGSLVVALAALVPMRRRAVRENREARR